MGDVAAVSDLWWKNAVVYCLDVETYLDSDGDGVGDFRGLTHRVDYLAGLGVTCIWLLPFYPTPNRDDGYDVADYYNVDPRFGTLGDFVEFVRTARERGIRVVIDLVVNHTSSDHAWFQAARADRGSPYRDWYVWADEEPDEPRKVIFPDQEESNWEWDEEAGQYYLHRFYASEPDLNVANPEVRDEIHRIMGFWLQLGVSGFRVDAVPYLIGPAGIEDQMPEDPHRVLRDMRDFLSRRQGDAVMFGEVNLAPGEREEYFGEYGDQMTGLFNFTMAGAVFASLAGGDARPLVRHVRETARPPSGSQWLNFLRNHDELNLTHLGDDERQRVMEAFAPEQRMGIYGRGIRRRLPPMLQGDQRRIRLAYSLLFTLPGTPVLLYGEEIGLGDDLSLEGRRSVRTPMQWSSGPNGGFSTADPVRPVVHDDRFGPDAVNAADQRREPESLLSWMERAIRVRKESPELGWGRWRVLDAPPTVLVHVSEWDDGTMVCLHNLGDEPQELTVELELDGDVDELADVFGDRAYEPVGMPGRRARLEPHGYRWLRARRKDSRWPIP